MKKWLLIFIAGMSFSNAFAYYDYQTGNSYTVTPQVGGGAKIYGNNNKTGSSWNTTIDNNGNQRGLDSKGNSWNYNRSIGAYANSNGTSCYGKGLGRTCSK